VIRQGECHRCGCGCRIRVDAFRVKIVFSLARGSIWAICARPPDQHAPYHPCLPTPAARDTYRPSLPRRPPQMGRLAAAAAAVAVMAVRVAGKTVPATNVTVATRACQGAFASFPFCNTSLSVHDRVLDLIGRLQPSDIAPQVRGRGGGGVRGWEAAALPTWSCGGNPPLPVFAADGAAWGRRQPGSQRQHHPPGHPRVRLGRQLRECDWGVGRALRGCDWGARCAGATGACTA
jgi:hypothetical protein